MADLRLFTAAEAGFSGLPAVEWREEVARQVVCDRAALLPLLARVLRALEWREDALRAAAADPALFVTARALRRAAEDGVPFRDAYQEAAGAYGRTCNGTATDDRPEPQAR